MANTIKVNKSSVTLPIERTEKFNHPYFKVCLVRATTIKDNEDITLHVFATREGAEKYADYARKDFCELYSVVWVREELVWCE